jgi:uncharacterized phage protein (TIGR01671 family)
MREIKFRGRISTGLENAGQWVYWGISGTDLIDSIDPETIGQFTDLHDKNGKEIYEGDIVRNHWTDCNGKFIGNKWEVKFGEYDDSEIEWGSPGIGFYCENKHGEQQSIINLPVDRNHITVEVIGNIYDNPELLEAS